MDEKKEKIIVFKNKDKDGWYEEWDNNRDLLNFPHPFRCLVCANPGSGKTNMVKNIIVKAKPFFKKIYLCHYDPETEEYDDLDCKRLEQLPTSKYEKFNKNTKSLLIIDDYDFQSLSKYEMNDLRSLFKYGSTHKGVSIIVATQDFFNIPPIIRRLASVYFIWKGSADLDSLFKIGRRVGYTKEEFKKLLDMCNNKFDNICIDFTPGSPHKVRFNAYTPIKSDSISFKSIYIKDKNKSKSKKSDSDSEEEEK